MVNRPTPTLPKRKKLARLKDLGITEQKAQATHMTTAYSELVKIKSGCFVMGSTNGKNNELPPPQGLYQATLLYEQVRGDL